jgi:hypothetical protein
MPLHKTFTFKNSDTVAVKRVRASLLDRGFKEAKDLEEMKVKKFFIRRKENDYIIEWWDKFTVAR